MGGDGGGAHGGPSSAVSSSVRSESSSRSRTGPPTIASSIGDKDVVKPFSISLPAFSKAVSSSFSRAYEVRPVSLAVAVEMLSSAERMPKE